MDLKSGIGYWPAVDGPGPAHPSITRDASCDVLVVGGGITGAIIAHDLTEQGRDVLVVDRRRAGLGSTSATTGLLQYEVDSDLVGLRATMGRKAADRVFRLCHDAVDDLEDLAKTAGPCGFRRAPSLYVASRRQDLTALRDEFRARGDLGFEVEWEDQERLDQEYGLVAPGAIRSAQAAYVDAYRLTHRLLRRVEKEGGGVHDQTAIAGWRAGRDAVVAKTSEGRKITARHIVVATGYEAASHLPRRFVTLRSTFAVATKPLGVWARRLPLLWETARPYLYVRPTQEGGLLVGGLDEPFRDPKLRDALVDSKSKGLVRAFAEKFPNRKIRVERAWAGTFGDTADQLAYIGPLRGTPRVHYALGYGANGIVFAAVAARLMGDLTAGRRSSDLKLFAFNRSSKTLPTTSA